MRLPRATLAPLALTLALILGGPTLLFAQERPLAAGSDGVPVPKKEKHVQPVYPRDALAQGIRGIVILDLVIDTEGRVTETVIIRSIPGLDEAALAAARQWRYQPVEVNGETVSVRLTVPITFALKLPEMTRQEGIPELRQGVTPAWPTGGAPGGGLAVADVTLESNGRVGLARIVEGEDPWSTSLLQALRTWRFRSLPDDVTVSFRVDAEFLRGGPEKGGVELRLSGLRETELFDTPGDAPLADAGSDPVTDDPQAEALPAPAPSEPAEAPTATTADASPPATSPEITEAQPVAPLAPSEPAEVPVPAKADASPPATSPVITEPQPVAPLAPSEPAEAPTTATADASTPATRPEIAEPQPVAPPAPPEPAEAPTAATADAGTPATSPEIAEPQPEAVPALPATAPLPGAPAAPNAAPPGAPGIVSPAGGGVDPTAPPPIEVLTAAPPPLPPENGISAIRGVELEPGVPDLTRGRRPVAPPFARMAGTNGVVTVEFSVSAGGVTTVQRTDGPEIFRPAATQAVESWTFRRTRADRAYLIAAFTYEDDLASAVVRPQPKP